MVRLAAPLDVVVALDGVEQCFINRWILPVLLYPVQSIRSTDINTSSNGGYFDTVCTTLLRLEDALGWFLLEQV